MKECMNILKEMLGEKPKVTVTETDENGTVEYDIPEEKLPYVTSQDIEDLIEQVKKDYPTAVEERTLAPDGKILVNIKITE